MVHKVQNATLSFLSLLLAFFCLPVFAAATPVNVKGRIFTASGPLEGARVFVYRSYEDIVAEKSFLSSEPADGRGLYGLRVEPGEYYFIARGSNENGEDFFAYHGGNPIVLGTENIWLGFMANKRQPAAYSKGDTAMRGSVTYKGEPVPNAYVAVYTLDARKFKGLGFLSDKGIGFMKSADAQGTFDFALPPNQYVVIARKMKGEKGIRPLRKEDLYCYGSANPVEVKSGRVVEITVPCYPKEERSAFVKTPRIKDNDYPTLAEARKRKKYGIKGQVTDGRGKPMQGVYVIAYPTQDISQATSEAENIDQTDAMGNFFIPLDAGGNYGLVVRDSLGGAPTINGISELYNKDDPWRGISFQAGELIEDINISIEDEQMMLFVE